MQTEQRNDTQPAAEPSSGMSRREEIATAVFGTWMITGLFLDGWAHNAGKTETFFSPWHGVLYSGFAAAMLFFAWDGFRSRGTLGAVASGPDRLVTLGLGLFVAGAVGDGLWHEIFGVEEDLEALLSPTHLSLMIGGLLMVTGPVRTAWHRRGEDAPSFGRFLPTLVCLTLAVGLVSFFSMYLSAFHVDAVAFQTTRGVEDALEVWGVASILVSNLLLLGAMLWTLRRWIPPVGSFTLLFGAVALAVSGLRAFENLPLVPSAIAGGIVADLLVARLGVGTRAARIVGAVVPVVLWGSWFVLFHLSHGLGWSVELWTGTVVLAAMSGLGLSVLVFPPDGAVRPTGRSIR